MIRVGSTGYVALIQSTRRSAQGRACGRALSRPRPLFLIVDCRNILRLLGDLLAPAQQVPGDLLLTCYVGLGYQYQVPDIER